MRAVTLDYSTRSLVQRDVPQPPVPGPSEVRLRIHETGVCGTDRDLSRFLFGYPPEGDTYLVLGHEALAEVAEIGSSVSTLRPGDWVVPIVRRPCTPPCASCRRFRQDLCVTGQYTERGIMGAHGYFTEYAIDAECDLVRIPPDLTDVAVLVEPLSVVEKAVETALVLHRYGPGTALVIGAGTVGILAALTLRARGLQVRVCSLEEPASARAALIRGAGFPYVNHPGAGADIVIEAAGTADAGSAALSAMAPLGVLVVLGAATVRGEFPLRQLILNNQLVTGSVNASPDAFRRAVEDLGGFPREVLKALIRRLPFSAFSDSILGPPQDIPKIVHVING